jgi:hypothetical protein
MKISYVKENDNYIKGEKNRTQVMGTGDLCHFNTIFFLISDCT